MGRPINIKDSIPCRFYEDGNEVNGFIVKQKTSNTFICEAENSSSTKVCRIVNKQYGLTEGECLIIGVSRKLEFINIVRISNNIMNDVNGLRYTWEIQHDSTEYLLMLTEIENTV